MVVLGGFTSALIRPNLSRYQAILTGVALWANTWEIDLARAPFGLLCVPGEPAFYRPEGFCRASLDLRFAHPFRGIAEARPHHVFRTAVAFPAARPRAECSLDAGQRIRRALSVSSFDGILLARGLDRRATLERRIPAVPRFVTHAVPALLCVVAVAYGVRTISRNRDWRER